VHSDTRSLQPGDLFVALRGERFDAHDFWPQAGAAGAVAALAERGLDRSRPAGPAGAGQPGRAGRCSPAWRAHHHLPLIAVTGSNGKTTVTQMIGQHPARLAGASALLRRKATSTTTSACR
jgi:UDP-N-acetylmuramoyl-tripeptide--D-alanyl-D-alanine ligase